MEKNVLGSIPAPKITTPVSPEVRAENVKDAQDYPEKGTMREEEEEKGKQQILHSWIWISAVNLATSDRFVVNEHKS